MLKTENVTEKYRYITEKIKDIILRNTKDVLAILYIGSWGRSEMSYIIDDGDVKFLNDIDVLVLTEDKIDDIKFLRDEVSKAINKDYFSYEDYIETEGIHNFYVDIRNYSLEEIKNISSRIKYYDIFNEPSIIYIKDLDTRFPIIDVNNICLQDGLIHLFNRMALLIEWNPDVIKKDKLLLILALKSYSAILDSLLLTKRKYVTSLQKKAEIFESCFKDDFYLLWEKSPDLVNRINKAVDMKINYYKYHEKIDEGTILNIWNQAKVDIIIATIFTINFIYNTNFDLSTESRNINKILKFLRDKNGFPINPFIKEFTKKKLGFEKLSSESGPFINLVYILIRYKYFSKFNGMGDHKNNRYMNIIKKSISSTKEPTTQLYLATFSLLGSMNYSSDGAKHDNYLRYIANSYLDNISIDKENVNMLTDDIIDKFRKIFRTWELFTFEQ